VDDAKIRALIDRDEIRDTIVLFATFFGSERLAEMSFLLC
jgi:hypothetical protein